MRRMPYQPGLGVPVASPLSQHALPDSYTIGPSPSGNVDTAAFINSLASTPEATRQSPLYQRFLEVGRQLTPDSIGRQNHPLVGTSYADMGAADRDTLQQRIAADMGRRNSSMPLGPNAGFMPGVTTGGQPLNPDNSQFLSPVERLQDEQQQREFAALQERQRQLLKTQYGGGVGPLEHPYVPTNNTRSGYTGTGGLISTTRPPQTTSNSTVVEGRFGGPRLLGPTAQMEPDERQVFLANQRARTLGEQQSRLAPYIQRRDAVRQFKQDRLDNAVETMGEGKLGYVNARRAARGLPPLTGALTKKKDEKSATPSLSQRIQRAEQIGLPRMQALRDSILSGQLSREKIKAEHARLSAIPKTSLTDDDAALLDAYAEYLRTDPWEGPARQYLERLGTQMPPVSMQY